MRRIQLGGKYSHLYTIVDDEDYDWLIQYKWHLSAKRYVEATIDGINFYMHRMISKCPDDKVIDHINRDSFDNRKTNLRICTQAQNATNNPKKKNNTSGYIGVVWHKDISRWIAYIRVNYKRKHIGTFKDKQDAARAYNTAATKYFGEFANLNYV